MLNWLFERIDTTLKARIPVPHLEPEPKFDRVHRTWLAIRNWYIGGFSMVGISGVAAFTGAANAEPSDLQWLLFSAVAVFVSLICALLTAFVETDFAYRPPESYPGVFNLSLGLNEAKDIEVARKKFLALGGAAMALCGAAIVFYCIAAVAVLS